MTNTINKWRQFNCKHYHPVNRHFLFIFLNRLFSHIHSKKSLQVLDKTSGEILHRNLNIELQSPMEAPLNTKFKLSNHCDKLNYFEFVKYMTSNPEEFTEYMSKSYPPPKFGKEEPERNSDKRDMQEFKRIVLNSSKHMLVYAPQNLIAQFELISPKCKKGRHVVITLSGFLSEKDNNLEAWKGI